MIRPATIMQPSTDTTTVIAQVSVVRVQDSASQDASIGSIEGTSLPVPKAY